MRILVTGASGFIGKYVMQELDNTEHLALAFLGDVRDRNTFPGESFDVIIHLAAKVDKRFWQSDDFYQVNDLYQVNVEGTKNLLEYYLDSKFIYVSSADVEKESLSKYAGTKKIAEDFVLANPSNLVIRPPSVFGPGDPHDKLIPRLFRKHLKGEKCEILNNDENEYMYVQDVSNRIIVNMNRTGIVRLEIGSFKIRNLDLDAMIRAVCQGETLDLYYEQQYFFDHLKQCLPSVGETKQL